MNIPNDTGNLIARCSGVSLVRFGIHGRTGTRYEVQEPDHVAGFSRRHFPAPLSSAIDYFLDHANRRYMHREPFPKSLRKVGP